MYKVFLSYLTKEGFKVAILDDDSNDLSKTLEQVESLKTYDVGIASHEINFTEIGELSESLEDMGVSLGILDENLPLPGFGTALGGMLVEEGIPVLFLSAGDEPPGEKFWLKWYRKGPKETYNLIFEGLKKCFENQSVEENFFEETVEKAVADISSLKHRIAHCFLSIDVDLQGISTAEETNLGEAKEYLANVLWGNEGEPHKPLGYYVEKLKEARRLAGLEEEEPNTIQKMLVDQDLLSNEHWICVKRLLGDGPIYNSSVYPLLAALDSLLGGGCCKIREEQLSILNDDKMETLVEYFSDLRKCWDESKTETEISWDFDECFVEGMSKYSFHDWFVSLNEALDKLRTDLPV